MELKVKNLNGREVPRVQELLKDYDVSSSHSPLREISHQSHEGLHCAGRLFMHVWSPTGLAGRWTCPGMVCPPASCFVVAAVLANH